MENYAKKMKMEEIFTEKYRPKSFDNVIGLDNQIENLVKDGNIPHLLFIGSQGTGKTTTAKIIVKELGAECLLLNASKDRGIDVIRNKIEPFATKKSDKLKIVFLDEFDHTTPAFQTALRNFMETHARTTRFIATCNYPSKIIGPLLSRFSKFSFGSYKNDEKKQYINYIIQKENIKIDEETLELLVSRFKDDIRGIVNFLNQNKSKEIKKDDITQQNLSVTILSKLMNGEWFQLRQDLLTKNIEYENLLEEMDKITFNHPKLSLNKKRNINNIIAEGMFQMYFSFNKEIAFSSILAKLQDELQRE